MLAYNVYVAQYHLRKAGQLRHCAMRDKEGDLGIPGAQVDPVGEGVVDQLNRLARSVQT